MTSEQLDELERLARTSGRKLHPDKALALIARVRELTRQLTEADSGADAVACQEALRRSAQRAMKAEADRDRLAAEVERLRELLWLRHGCSVAVLYGDDGEKQCSVCGIDFKTMTAEQMIQQWERIGRAALAEAPTPAREESPDA